MRGTCGFMPWSVIPVPSVRRENGTEPTNAVGEQRSVFGTVPRFERQPSAQCRRLPVSIDTEAEQQ
jgi:hypothetical protein